MRSFLYVQQMCSHLPSFGREWMPHTHKHTYSHTQLHTCYSKLRNLDRIIIRNKKHVLLQSLKCRCFPHWNKHNELPTWVLLLNCVFVFFCHWWWYSDNTKCLGYPFYPLCIITINMIIHCYSNISILYQFVTPLWTITRSYINLNNIHILFSKYIWFKELT